MNELKAFTGFLSSSANPGDLSLTVASITKAIIWGVATLAVVKGVDSTTVTNEVQQIMDLTATAVAAGLTLYHSGQTIYGLIRKVLYAFAAKPVAPVI